MLFCVAPSTKVHSKKYFLQPERYKSTLFQLKSIHCFHFPFRSLFYGHECQQAEHISRRLHQPHGTFCTLFLQAYGQFYLLPLLQDHFTYCISHIYTFCTQYGWKSEDRACGLWTMVKFLSSHGRRRMIMS